MLPDDALDGPRLGRPARRGESEPPDVAADAIGPYLDSAEMLGRRTAELHEVLAAGRHRGVRARAVHHALPAVALPVDAGPGPADAVAGPPHARRRSTTDRRVADASTCSTTRPTCSTRSTRCAGTASTASRIRVHGDYHLGQVLHAGRDFVIIDFEGEPSRSPTERRIKRGALTDVAGIVRSFQYAAEAGLRDQQAPRAGAARPARGARGAGPGVADLGHDRASSAPTSTEADGHPFVPTDPADTHALLTAYVLDKALYEVRYDLDHRPDWAPDPVAGRGVDAAEPRDLT